MATDHYAVLGVRFDATGDEIKAAYREKTIRYHPDHYGEDSGPFLAVQEAFAVLSDPERRRAHDRSLRGPRRRAGAGPVRPDRSPVEPLVPEAPGAAVEPLVPGEPASVGQFSMFESFATFTPSFEEIFDRLWSSFGSAAPPKSGRIETVTVEIPVSREEALRGGSARVLVPARITCPNCRGRGGVGPYECWRCSGEGSLIGTHPVSVPFPPGMPDNYTVRISLDPLGIRNLLLACCFRVATAG